jgi:hypothetical protein
VVCSTRSTSHSRGSFFSARRRRTASISAARTAHGEEGEGS